MGEDRIETNASADLATEAVVLNRLIDVHPVVLDLGELVRELLGEDPAFERRDAIERAVDELTGVGLLHNREGLLTPTRAALRFGELAER